MTARIRLFAWLFCLSVFAGASYWSAVRAGAQSPGPQLRQIAYLKASNSEGADHFACGGSLPGHTGNALAISGDGNTVVVGAPHESSAARGINGNQDDNSLYNSGAVYVYVRRGDTWTQQAYLKASNPGRSDHIWAQPCLEPRRKHAGRRGAVGGQRRHRRQCQSGRRLHSPGWRRVRLYANWRQMVTAGVSQGIEHRPQGRRGRHRRGPVRVCDRAECRRRHAGCGRHRGRQRRDWHGRQPDR